MPICSNPPASGVKRLAVDFVNGGLCDLHVTALSVHEKIDVVGYAIGGFHIDAGEILAASEAREAIVMDLDQIEREIFALIFDVKLSVARLFGLARDVLFDSDGDIGLAHILCPGATLLISRCLGQLHLLTRVFRMLAGCEQRHRRREK